MCQEKAGTPKYPDSILLVSMSHSTVVLGQQHCYPRTTILYTSKIRRLPPFWRTFCIADDEVASTSMSMRFSPIYGALVMVIEGH